MGATDPRSARRRSSQAKGGAQQKQDDFLPTAVSGKPTPKEKRKATAEDALFDEAKRAKKNSSAEKHVHFAPRAVHRSAQAGQQFKRPSRPQNRQQPQQADDERPSETPIRRESHHRGRGRPAGSPRLGYAHDRPGEAPPPRPQHQRFPANGDPGYSHHHHHHRGGPPDERLRMNDGPPPGGSVRDPAFMETRYRDLPGQSAPPHWGMHPSHPQRHHQRSRSPPPPQPPQVIIYHHYHQGPGPSRGRHGSRYQGSRKPYRGRGSDRGSHHQSLNLGKVDKLMGKYGNYHNYYKRRHSNSDNVFACDPRCEAIDKEWIRNKDCIDFGCNEAKIGIELGSEYLSKRMVGIDVDKQLIKRANWNLSDKMRTFGDKLEEARGVKDVSKVHAYEQNLKALEGMEFIPIDFFNYDYEEKSFDTVLCFSVLKWVHLNRGDEGIRGLFKIFSEILRVGGKLCLEYQSWKSYKNAQNRKELKKYFEGNPPDLHNPNSFKIFPDMFQSILENYGFIHVAESEECKQQKTFTERPLKFFRRTDEEIKYKDDGITPFEKTLNASRHPGMGPHPYPPFYSTPPPPGAHQGFAQNYGPPPPQYGAAYGPGVPQQPRGFAPNYGSAMPQQHPPYGATYGMPQQQQHYPPGSYGPGV